MRRLDERDMMLMEQLRVDGRATFEALAAKVGLSRTAVRARVQRILSSGALRIVAMVHPEIEGITASGHVSISLASVSSLDVAQVISTLRDVPFVSTVAGQHAIIAELRCADMGELFDAVKSIRGIDGVQAVDTLTYVRVVKQPYVRPAGVEQATAAALDEVDHRLLGLLQDDARISYSAMATMVGMTRSATRTRVIRLLRDGIVTITGRINPTSFGMTQMCGFAVNLDGRTNVLEKIANLDAVDFLACALGRYDAVGTLITRTRSDTIEALDHIRQLAGVEQLDSWAHLQLVKEDYDRRRIPTLAKPNGHRRHVPGDADTGVIGRPSRNNAMTLRAGTSA